MTIEPVCNSIKKTDLLLINNKKNINEKTYTTDVNENYKDKLPIAYPPIPGINFGKLQPPTYDSFTGLRDKKCLMRDLDTMMNSQEPKQNITVAMFDLDNFKSVNELLGYQTGDDFIRAASNDVSEVASERGFNSYRFGGDEFVILIDNKHSYKEKDTVNEILKRTNNNEVIKSKEAEYAKNASERLAKYQENESKLNKLYYLKAKKDILTDLHENLTTETAKNDKYLLDGIKSVDTDLNNIYTDLIDKSLEDEKDDETRNWLSGLKDTISNGDVKVSEDDEKLDEYLHIKFDKTFEISRLKKWISDFDKNGGFSVTGAVVCFTPEYYENKISHELINETGEVLKKGKNSKKGIGYYEKL